MLRIDRSYVVDLVRFYNSNFKKIGRQAAENTRMNITFKFGSHHSRNIKNDHALGGDRNIGERDGPGLEYLPSSK